MKLSSLHAEPLPILSYQRRASVKIPATVVGVLTVTFAITFAWLSVSRHLAYQSHAFDLGNMDQAVWNTLQGQFLRFTDMEVHGRVLTTRLAIHVEPILILLAPLYLIHSGPETLLVVQSVVVATGAIPAYLLAYRAIGHPWLAIVFPLAYFLHPSLQNALLDDFHAVTLSAPFLLWALYFVWTDRIAPFSVVAVLAMATKEEIGLIVALLGVLLLGRRHSRAGVVAIVGGVVWFALCVAVIIPHFNPGGSPYLGRYRYLGHGLGGILSGIFLHPDRAISTLTSLPRLEFLHYLLEPLGFVPILGLPVLLLAAPGALIDMLSSDSRMYSGFYQYTAEIIPFVVGAAAIGVGWTGSLIRRRWETPAIWTMGALCLLILVSAAEQSWRYGFTPAARGYSIPSPGQHQALEDSMLRTIPNNAVVAAADEIEPHLSDRRSIYLFPTIHPANGPAAQYIVLDASVPSSPFEPYGLHLAATDALVHGYGIQSAKDGILILHCGAPRHRLPETFYSFIFAPSVKQSPAHIHWGPLTLVSATTHPTDALVDRSRPAIGVETYWRVTGPIPSNTSIDESVTPVYSGADTPSIGTGPSGADSPTLDWLPISRWPRDRTIRVDFVPSTTSPPYTSGKVDVLLRVHGLGPVKTSGPHRARIEPNNTIVLATYNVDG